jgi:hypothetical protein
MPRLKGYIFPRAIIAYAVWVYHHFALSTADVEDLLAERDVMVSRGTVQKWVNRFVCQFANSISNVNAFVVGHGFVAQSRNKTSRDHATHNPVGQWMHCVKLLGQRLSARDFDRQVQRSNFVPRS